MTDKECKLHKRLEEIESFIGHLKADHQLDRCHLKGSEGDALHAVLREVGCNILWLLRFTVKKGLGLYFCLLRHAVWRERLKNWPKSSTVHECKTQISAGCWL